MRRGLVLRCLLAAVAFGLWAAPAGAIGPTPPSWKPRETVTSTLADYLDMVGADRSLAFDHHGNPGIAFFDDVGSDLRYAQSVPSVGWVHSAIDTGGNVGSYPSLAYDHDERPAISYFDQTNFDLKYARLNGSAWQIETIDMTNSVGQYTSLAFDLLGRPAIAYQDFFNTSLKYVQDTDGDFSLVDETPVTVVNQFNEGRYASLVFDPWNRPMIAHTDATNNDLRFSVQEPGGWVTTTVDSPGSTGWYPSIAIDPDTDFPAIAYFDDSTDDLRYADWDGDSWNPTTVDATDTVGIWSSLAFDQADGNPAIAYHDQTNFDLKLAWNDGSIWQTQTVDAVGTVGRTPSLAFNDYGSGFPSIAYFDVGAAGSGSLFFIDIEALPVGLPGDYNDDGAVDSADYVVWRKFLSSPTFDLPNEGVTEGTVTSGDYDVWRNNFGSATGGGGAMSGLVPEPSSLFLGCLGYAVVAARRTRRAVSRLD